MNYEKYLSDRAKMRGPAQLRELAKATVFASPKDASRLCGGLPTPEIFPIKEINLILKDGSTLHLDETLMREAQQYGITEGYTPFLKLLYDYQKRIHNPPYDGYEITVTSGCQDGVHKSVETFLNPGDYLIGNDYCYSALLETLRPLGIKFLGVHHDKYGMCPQSLRNCLKQWDVKACHEKRGNVPKVLYFVPNGGNPDGVNLEASRRRELYKIAQEYDLIILEDDPYQFIVFDQDIPPSFLSLDTDGRVVRCDSFSKTISPGFRVGYITAAKPFIEKLIYYLQLTNQHTPGLSQAIIYKLLTKWGFEGYQKKVKDASEAFKKQKDLCLKYLTKWLTGLVEYDEPAGGMFLWLKLLGVEDGREICKECARRMAIFAPGHIFKDGESKTPYFRVSYSLATEHEFDYGFRVLAEVLREHLNSVCNGKAH